MKPYLDPTRTYTQLAPDVVFPFEAIDQFKAWHDAVMNALKLKDEKIQQLESHIRRLEKDDRGQDLEAVSRLLDEARRDMLGAQIHIGEMNEISKQLQVELGKLRRQLESAGVGVYPDFHPR